MKPSMSMFMTKDEYYRAAIKYEQNRLNRLIYNVLAITRNTNGWDKVPFEIHKKIDDAVNLAKEYKAEQS